MLFTILLLSLAGIPPLAGFFAKYILIKGMINNSNPLVIIAFITSSVISLFYYLKIIKNTYMHKEKTEANPTQSFQNSPDITINITLALIAVFTFAYPFINFPAFFI
jgi:NADH-quinone oxidoreductase subunit N